MKFWKNIFRRCKHDWFVHEEDFMERIGTLDLKISTIEQTHKHYIDGLTTLCHELNDRLSKLEDMHDRLLRMETLLGNGSPFVTLLAKIENIEHLIKTNALEDLDNKNK